MKRATVVMPLEHLADSIGNRLGTSWLCLNWDSIQNFKESDNFKLIGYELETTGVSGSPNKCNVRDSNHDADATAKKFFINAYQT